MSAIGDLFGGGSSGPSVPMSLTPTPLQATPTINDAASLTAAQEARARLRKRFGTDSAILTSGLGDTSFSSASVSHTNATAPTSQSN